MRRRILIFTVVAASTVALLIGWVSSYWHMLSIAEWRGGVVYFLIIEQGEICCERQSPGPPYFGPSRLLWEVTSVDEYHVTALTQGYKRTKFHALGFVAGRGRVSRYVWIPLWFFGVLLILCSWVLWRWSRKRSSPAFPIQESPPVADQNKTVHAASVSTPLDAPFSIGKA